MLAGIENEIVLRPRLFAPHLRSRWLRGLWFLPLAIIGLSRQTPLRALIILAGSLAFSGIALAVSTRLRLALMDGTIVRRGWWGRVVRCPVAAVADVVELTASISWVGPPETWLLFRGADGGTLMRAVVSTYPPDDVERFLDALGLPVTRVQRVLSVREARREFPGSFHWPWAHYWLTIWSLLIGGLFAAVFVLAIVDAIR